VSFNIEKLSVTALGGSDAPSIYSYFSPDDLSTTIASGYFNKKKWQFHIGDVLFIDISGDTYVYVVKTCQINDVTVEELTHNVAGDFNHNDLANLNVGDYLHLTAAEKGDFGRLTDGSDVADLHSHKLQNIVHVAQSGGDFNSIQAAINYIDALTGDDTPTAINRYMIRVSPGIYAENILNENFISIMGTGGGLASHVKIQPTEGTVAYTTPYTEPFGIGGLYNITVDTSLMSANNAVGILCPAGTHLHGFHSVRVNCASGIPGNVGTAIKILGGTAIVYSFGELAYRYSGTAASGTHNIIDVQNGNFDFYSNECPVEIKSVECEVNFLKEDKASSLPTRFFNNNITMAIESDPFDGVARFYYSSVDNTNKNIFGNIIRILGKDDDAPSSVNHGEAYHVETTDGDGLVKSTSNRIVVRGFKSNYIADLVNAGDSLQSHFDEVDATDGAYGDGFETVPSGYVFVNSPSPGNLQISGAYKNMYDAVKTVGPRGCDYTGIQEALTAEPYPNILFTVQPDIYDGDTIVFTNDNQTVQGISESNQDAEIRNTTTICNGGNYTGCKVSRIKMVATLTTNDSVVTLANGSCSFDDVINELTVTGTAYRYPKNYTITGSGTMTILRGEVTQTNSSGTVLQTYVFAGFDNLAGCIIPGGTGTIKVDGTKITATKTGQAYIFLGAGTYSPGTQIEVNRCDITIDGSGADYLAVLTGPTGVPGFCIGCGTSGGTGTLYFGFNNVIVTGRTDTAGSTLNNNGCIVSALFGDNTTGVTINSRYSNYVCSGGITNYAAAPGGYTIVNSSFDAFSADGGVGIGTPPAWSGASVVYTVGIFVEDGGKIYRCITEHTSSGANQPPSAVWVEDIQENYSFVNYVSSLSYGNLDISGELTVGSYERHIQIPARIVGNPSNSPTAIKLYTAGGLRFSGTTDNTTYCQWEIPDDWVGDDIIFEVDWLPGAGSIAAGATVIWTINYRAIAEGELINQGTVKTISTTFTGALTQDTVEHTPFTLPYNDANQPLTKQDHIFFEVLRSASSDTYGGTTTVTAFEIIYNSNKLPQN